MENESESCDNCIYSFETPTGQDLRRQLLCRRYPPTAVGFPVANGILNSTQWPVIQVNQWCGEYKAKARVLQ